MTYEITSQTIKVDHLHRDNITTILKDGENIIVIATYPREDQAWIDGNEHEWSEWITDCTINDEWFEDYDIPSHHSALKRYEEHKHCVNVIMEKSK